MFDPEDRRCGLDSVVETITPSIAKRYLELAAKNRKVSAGKIRQFAGAMARDQWDLNAETIKFNTSGFLMDGQHRMHACILANTPFQALVVRNVPDDYFATIDTGKVRTAGDILSIDGEQYAHAKAAAVRWMVAIPLHSDPPQLSLGSERIRELLKEHPGLTESAKICHKATLIHPGLAAALHYLFSQKDQSEANRFIDDLARGADLEANDPVLILRQELIKHKSKRGVGKKMSVERLEKAALCIRAWNARRRGGGLTILRGLIKNHKTGVYEFPDIE